MRQAIRPLTHQSLSPFSCAVGIIFDSVSVRRRPSVKILNCDGRHLLGTKIARTAHGGGCSLGFKSSGCARSTVTFVSPVDSTIEASIVNTAVQPFSWYFKFAASSVGRERKVNRTPKFMRDKFANDACPIAKFARSFDDGSARFLPFNDQRDSARIQ